MRINNDLYSFEYDDLEQLISEKGRFNHDSHIPHPFSYLSRFFGTAELKEPRLRRLRIQKGLTQKEAAKKLGMKGLYSCTNQD